MAQRLHLTIGEVLSLLREEFPDVSISKIRFLESQGLVDPERTPSGYRKFYEADVERLRWILLQQKEHFLPLKVIRGRLEEPGHAGDTPTTAEDAVAAHRAAQARLHPDAVATPPPGRAVAAGDRAASGGSGSAAAPRPAASPGAAAPVRETAPVRKAVPVGTAAPSGDGARPAATAVLAAREARTDPELPTVVTAADGAAPDPSPVGAAVGGGDHPSPAASATPPGPADASPATPQSTAPQSAPPQSASPQPATPQPATPQSATPQAAGPGRTAPSPVGRTPPTAAGGSPGASGPGGAEPDVYTAVELASEVGCTPELIRDLEQYGILAPGAKLGGVAYFHAEAVPLARIGARFAELGVEPRHLRTWRNAAEREAGLFEQLVMPLLRQRNPQARQQAADRLVELTALGGELRSGLIAEAVRAIK